MNRRTFLKGFAVVLTAPMVGAALLSDAVSGGSNICCKIQDEYAFSADERDVWYATQDEYDCAYAFTEAGDFEPLEIS